MDEVRQRDRRITFAVTDRRAGARASTPTEAYTRPVRQLIFASMLLAVSSAGAARTVYRIELVGGSVLFAQEAPKISGDRLVFLSAPQGSLVSMKKSEVSKIEAIETENTPPPDYGSAKLHSNLSGIRPAGPLDRPSTHEGWDAGWKPPRSRWASMKTGREPGKTIAFPVSSDDLKPGNYEPFPVAPGGQSGPPPAYVEGRTVPKAGSLQEPPKGIQFGDAPKRANEKVAAPALVFSQPPGVEPTMGPAPPPDTSRQCP